MRAGACVVLLLVNVRASWPCTPAEQVLVCQTIPTAYSSGFTSLVMLVKDVGEINSTIFHSDSLASVTSLIMKSAGVSRIASGAFSSFQNLKSLSLSQNALTQVNPRWFGRPAALTELSLGENQIEVLDEFMFREFINLAKLNLTKNKIRTIKPNSFSFQTNLAELDLSGNRMTLVRPQVFRTLRSTEMSLEGNPWDCSCGVQDFVVFLKGLRNRSLLVRDTQVTCDRPLTLRGSTRVECVCVFDHSSICRTHRGYEDCPHAHGHTASQTQRSLQSTPSAAPTSDLRPTATPRSSPSSCLVFEAASPVTADDAQIIRTLTAVIVVLCVCSCVSCFSWR